MWSVLDTFNVQYRGRGVYPMLYEYLHGSNRFSKVNPPPCTLCIKGFLWCTFNNRGLFHPVIESSWLLSHEGTVCDVIGPRYINLCFEMQNKCILITLCVCGEFVPHTLSPFPPQSHLHIFSVNYLFNCDCNYALIRYIGGFLSSPFVCLSGQNFRGFLCNRLSYWD